MTNLREALERLADKAQALRDYTGAMPTIDVNGDDVFLKAARAIKGVEQAIADARAALSCPAPVGLGEEEIDAVAKIIDPGSFEGPRDPSTPTERELWKEHAPRYQDKARQKARAVLTHLSQRC